MREDLAFEFKSANKGKPLILDGAIGSLLHQMEYNPDPNIWMTPINKTHPEVIKYIHKSYIEAGANIITTNTFRTNPLALAANGISNSAPYVKDAVNLTKEAIDGRSIYIAGSNAPAEDCYQKVRKISYNELELNHCNHIDLLIDNEVHFILNETQSHFDEIRIICKHCAENKIPFIMSIFFDEKFNILSGETADDVIKFILEHEPLSIGINCVAPRLFESFLERLKLSYNWGYYLNCGGENYLTKTIKTSTTPNDYITTVQKSLKQNPSFIGACCGSNPAHINAIKEFFSGKNN